MNENSGASTFNAAEVLSVLWKRKVSFAISFAILFAISAVVTVSLPKVYSADATLLVTPGGGGQFQTTDSSALLTKTYAELLQNPAVANEVASKLTFSSSGSEVEGAVSVSPVSGSQLLDVTAENSNPNNAQQLANTFAEVSQAKAASLATAAAGPANITVAEPATLPTSPVRPKPSLYLLVGALLAAVLAAVVAVVRDRFEDRLRIDPSTTTVFGLPVIGRIPDRGFSPITSTRSEVAWRVSSEPWRFLLANLNFETPAADLTSLAVVSSGEQEGKSTCALSLARAASERGVATLLVDADMRLGTISTQFGEGDDDGLSTQLSNPSRIKPSEIPGTEVRFVPSGPLPDNPSALLSSESLPEFNERAASAFELIVYDTPPLRVGADASLVAANVDGVVLVIDAIRTNRSGALRAIDQLRRANANILGVVLNRFSERQAKQYGYQGSVLPGEDLRPARSERARGARTDGSPAARSARGR
jgi:tyrosine-protein kinase